MPLVALFVDANVRAVTTVAVLGGGIGGLSTAHELAQRGFDVTVYEGRKAFGGKARSLPVLGSGTDGRADLPAEHGFRFFPGFYRHLPDTMKRIPHGRQTVFDHLVAATAMMIARADGDNIIVGKSPPSSLDDLKITVELIRAVGTQLGIPAHELGEFGERLLTFLISCEQRRFAQWEQTSWWDFLDADHRSPAFQKYVAGAAANALFWSRAKEMSARTGGSILWQLIFDMARPGGRADRVLDGPTSEVWIDPWTAYLSSTGVVLRDGCEVTDIECDGHRITGVRVRSAAGLQRVAADHYVAALPVERLQPLLTPALLAAEPRLIAVQANKLKVRWMNGVMFYLDHDVPLVNGHILFVDSPWALTAVSQKQFWRNIDLIKRGDGRVQGILSVDVSDWERAEPRSGKCAKECSKEEIRAAVWAQIVDSIRDGCLEDKDVVTWFLDPAIQFTNPNTATSDEPLLVNSAGSWANRPDAVTQIPNLFLATDFVRTYTDLGTMEGANEAARRAVNGILEATGSRAPRCGVWKLDEPRVLALFKMVDWLRWRRGRPAKPPVKVTSAGQLQPTGTVVRVLLGAMRRGQTAFNSLRAQHD